MNATKFLSQIGLKENPFNGEEARHDPVFDRLDPLDSAHPDFAKIVGHLEQPSTAIVFGEKGSGKTAIRLMISREVARHNQRHPDRRLLLVGYDDLNPFLDRLRDRSLSGGRRGHGNEDEAIDQLLRGMKQSDHQDAILSLAVTRVVDGLLGVGDRSDGSAEGVELSGEQLRLARSMAPTNRIELAVMAAVYDQPEHGSALDRWPRVLRALRVGRIAWGAAQGWAAGLLGVVAAGLLVALQFEARYQVGLTLGAVAALVGAVWMGTLWGLRRWRIHSIARKVVRSCRTVGRSEADLRCMLGRLRLSDLDGQVWPTRQSDDARFQLMRRLLDWLRPMSYRGVLVLIDRVDEPTLVAGKAGRMRHVIWPILDNKFLQQQGIGFKLLLPIELRHEVRREDPDFFQRARLDKQHLVERLDWSGATLYDLCNARMRACVSVDKGEVSLKSLFSDDVSAEILIGALDQMKQPRDAFKFLYSVIQEHCRNLPDESGAVLIPRATLDLVLRQQAQRVIEFRRGESPG
ncbi:MAG: hypothetical protein JJU36_11860 [Phycisphaeraceae bacterium]|nr:hypothetical protein [Phycisphaeraceae bacterium]